MNKTILTMVNDVRLKKVIWYELLERIICHIRKNYSIAFFRLLFTNSREDNSRRKEEFGKQTLQSLCLVAG